MTTTPYPAAISRSELEALAAQIGTSAQALIDAAERMNASLRAIGPTLDELIRAFGVSPNRVDKLPRKTRKAMMKNAVGWTLTAGDARRIHRALNRQWIE